MLDVEEEYEPGRDGDCVLDHGPRTYRHHGPYFSEIKSRRSVKSIFLQVASVSCIYDEEYKRYEFRKAGAYGCSCYAKGREAQFAEDQDIIEDNIGQYHDDGVQRQCPGLRGAHIECSEYSGDEGEDHTRKSPSDITESCYIYGA